MFIRVTDQDSDSDNEHMKETPFRQSTNFSVCIAAHEDPIHLSGKTPKHLTTLFSNFLSAASLPLHKGFLVISIKPQAQSLQQGGGDGPFSGGRSFGISTPLNWSGRFNHVGVRGGGGKLFLALRKNPPPTEKEKAQAPEAEASADNYGGVCQ